MPFFGSNSFNNTTEYTVSSNSELYSAFLNSLKYSGIGTVGDSVNDIPITINISTRNLGSIGIAAPLTAVQLVGIEPDFVTSFTVVSISGVGQNREITLEFYENLSSLDIQADDYIVPDLRLDGPSGGNPTFFLQDTGSAVNLYSLAGAWKIKSVDTINNRITAYFNVKSNVPNPSGDIQGYWAIVKTKIQSMTFTDDGKIGNIKNVVITDGLGLNGGATYVKVSSPSFLKNVTPWDGSNLVCSNCAVSDLNINYTGYVRGDYAIYINTGITSYSVYMENEAAGTLEGSIFNGGVVALFNQSFVSLFDSIMANYTAGAIIQAVGGSNVSTESTLMQFVNCNASPLDPTLDTLSSDGSYINGTAPPN